jgi:hypothetical protein
MEAKAMNAFTADGQVISKMLNEADLFKVLSGEITSIKKTEYRRTSDKKGQIDEHYKFEISTRSSEAGIKNCRLAVQVHVKRDFMPITEIKYSFDKPICSD